MDRVQSAALHLRHSTDQVTSRQIPTDSSLASIFCIMMPDPDGSRSDPVRSRQIPTDPIGSHCRYEELNRSLSTLFSFLELPEAVSPHASLVTQLLH